MASVLFVPGPLSAQEPDELPNVIIVTFSGLGNEESLSDAHHQLIPDLYNDLFREGTLYTNLINLNYPFHMPVIKSINTGDTYERIEGKLKHCSIFQYIRGKYAWPPEKLWLIGEWYNCTVKVSDACGSDTFPSVLEVGSGQFKITSTAALSQQQKKLVETSRAVMGNSGQWPQWSTTGLVQFEVLKKILAHDRPKLVHYIANDVEVGHYHNYGSYLLAVKSINDQIKYLWDYIRSDEFYKDKTYLIVNVDHVRDKYFKEHEERRVIDQPVWLYIYGPDVKKGQQIGRPIYHPDIFATVAYLFGVQTHETKGKVLEDCFTKKGTQ